MAVLKRGDILKIKAPRKQSNGVILSNTIRAELLSEVVNNNTKTLVRIRILEGYANQVYGSILTVNSETYIYSDALELFEDVTADYEIY